MQLLVLHSNLLASVPAGLARLPLLTRLDLRDNQLRDVPPELLDAPFVRLQGNPLSGSPPTPRSPPGRPVGGEGAHHRQNAGVITVLTGGLSFHRDTRGPQNAQSVAELRPGQVMMWGIRGAEEASVQPVTLSMLYAWLTP